MDKTIFYIAVIVTIFSGVVSESVEDVDYSNSTSESTTSSTPTSATSSTPTSAPPTDKNVNVTLQRGSGTNATICFRMLANVNFSITYNQKGGKQAVALLQVPSSAHASANTKCSPLNAKSQLVELDFNNGNRISMLYFMLDDTNYALTNVSLTYTPTGPLFPDSASSVPITVNAPYSDTRFKASKNGYYLCASEFNEQWNNVNFTTRNLKVQAFLNDPISSKAFDGNAITCSADEPTDNIVPIAVGAALAGLIVIVLIAYIIGRQRNRTDYQSM